MYPLYFAAGMSELKISASAYHRPFDFFQRTTYLPASLIAWPLAGRSERS